jgi:N-acetylmuramoyl-L-alanine amidase CwlA
MQNYVLNESTIGCAKVVVDILPKGKVIPNTVIKPTSITIHNTGNIGAPAKNNHNYMKGLNKNGGRSASWHFTVDDQHIYQAVPTNKKAWHAGCASGNNSSIGIEICMFNDADRQRKCYENAIALVKILMKFHGFGVGQIKRHYDWTKKDCPTWLISGKFGYTWKWFQQQCNNASVVTPVPQPNTKAKYKNGSYMKKARVIAKDGLNIRKGRPNQPNYGTVIDVLPYGAIITVHYCLDDWFSVYIGKANPGFISGRYIEFID